MGVRPTHFFSDRFCKLSLYDGSLVLSRYRERIPTLGLLCSCHSVWMVVAVHGRALELRPSHHVGRQTVPGCRAAWQRWLLTGSVPKRRSAITADRLRTLGVTCRQPLDGGAKWVGVSMERKSVVQAHGARAALGPICWQMYIYGGS